MTKRGLRERVLAHGVEILAERVFGPGNHAFYVADPGGNVVALTERATDWAGRPVAPVPVVTGRDAL